MSPKIIIIDQTKGVDYVKPGTIRDDGKPGEKLDHGINGWPYKNCQCDNCTYWRKRGQGK